MATRRDGDDKVLELLWGTGKRPNRGPRPALSLTDIVGKAVEVADADGLDAVTMRRVATDLSFTTMALYRYVPGKRALVELAVDAVGAELPRGNRSGAGWRVGLASWATDYYRLLFDHPWLLQIDFGSGPTGPNQVEFTESGLSAMADTGLTGCDMLAVLLVFTGFVRGAAQVFHQTSAAARSRGVPSTEFGQIYGAALQQVIDPKRFPILAGAIGEGVFEIPDDDEMADFRFGLERLLDGVEAHIAACS